MEEQSMKTANEKISKYLSDNDLSLRKFSSMVGISCSTLSRIMKGTQSISLTNLKKLSNYLPDIVNDLYTKESDRNQNEINEPSADNQYLNNEQLRLNYSFFHSSVEDLLQTSDIANDTDISKEMIKQFDYCKEFANTQNGIDMIKTEFDTKVNKSLGIGPLLDSLKELYKQYIAEIPTSAKAILIGAALLYFIIPIDAIPDFIFGIGYLDDLLILLLVKSNLLTSKLSS